MERALALERIEIALASTPGLPSAQELVRLLADVEIALFLRNPQLPEILLKAGWYLHGVAQGEAAEDLYSPQRRREAWRVSAHIFDLALEYEGHTKVDQLRYAFASQVGYIRGELNPNSIAIFRRIKHLIKNISIDDQGSFCSHFGSPVLGDA